MKNKPTPTAASTGTSKADYDLINRIVLRALTLCAANGVKYDRMTAFMDISTCHETTPLRLQDLLDANEFNFIHDILGIRQHMNRKTGQLDNCFIPRFTQRNKIKTVSVSKVHQAYEQKENGTGGRFAKLNPCYGCSKSAGKNYSSHRLTDCGWADLALCLCDNCALATSGMINPLEFIAYAEQHGGIKQADVARVREYWTSVVNAQTAIGKAKIAANFVPNALYADAVREVIALAEKALAAEAR